jgi:hypothetical protein
MMLMVKGELPENRYLPDSQTVIKAPFDDLPLLLLPNLKVIGGKGGLPSYNAFGIPQGVNPDDIAAPSGDLVAERLTELRRDLGYMGIQLNPVGKQASVYHMRLVHELLYLGEGFGSIFRPELEENTKLMVPGAEFCLMVMIDPVQLARFRSDFRVTIHKLTFPLHAYFQPVHPDILVGSGMMMWRPATERTIVEALKEDVLGIRNRDFQRASAKKQVRDNVKVGIRRGINRRRIKEKRTKANTINQQISAGNSIAKLTFAQAVRRYIERNGASKEHRKNGSPESALERFPLTQLFPDLADILNDRQKTDGEK